MKFVTLVVSLFLACSIAQAETIELGSESCTQSNICYGTPNNMQLPIAYLNFGAAAPGDSSWLGISFGGTIYGAGGVYPTITRIPGPNNTMVTTYVFEDVLLEESFGGTPGTTVTLSIIATVVGYPCVRSGRGIVCQTVSTLVDGTLVTP